MNALTTIPGLFIYLLLLQDMFLCISVIHVTAVLKASREALTLDPTHPKTLNCKALNGAMLCYSSSLSHATVMLIIQWNYNTIKVCIIVSSLN